MKLFGIIGLCVTAAVIGVTVWLVYGQKDQKADPASTSAAETATLGAAAPTDVGRNAASAKEHAQRQVCLASCASVHRTCKATAPEPAAVATCDTEKNDCEAHCP